jgi:hypothetical protein
VLTRIRRPLTATCLLALSCAIMSPVTALADSATTVGWVRLAHLSPNTPPVDVYLYPYGGATAQIVLKHVAYGTLSPYQSLAPGEYLVAMRGAGAATTTNPVISTQVAVVAGRAYTVAGLGAADALTLQVLDDKLDAPQGKASVRVIEASLQSPVVSITAGGVPVATDLRFPAVSAYQTLDSGPCALRVATQSAADTTQLAFSADSTYTLAVLDGAGSVPKVLDLSDAAGTTAIPKGGVNTGFGGAAPQSGGGWPVWQTLWGLLLAAGVGSGLLAVRRLRRS